MLHRERHIVKTVQVTCLYELVSLSGETDSYLACRDPYGWANSCKENIAGNFANHVAYSPGGGHVVQLISIKSQVFFPASSQLLSQRSTKLLLNLHSGHKGIVDIRLVKIFDEVPLIFVSELVLEKCERLHEIHTQRCESQNRSVNLKQESSFLRRLIKRIPNIARPFLLRLQLNDPRITRSLDSSLIQNHGFLVSCHFQSLKIQDTGFLGALEYFRTEDEPGFKQIAGYAGYPRVVGSYVQTTEFRYDPCIYRHFDPAKMSHSQELFVYRRKVRVER